MIRVTGAPQNRSTTDRPECAGSGPPRRPCSPSFMNGIDICSSRARWTAAERSRVAEFGVDAAKMRTHRETVDCDQRGYVLTGRDLAGTKPPPGTHHRSDSVCRYVGHIARSPSTGPGRQGGDHDVVYVGMRKAMRATVVVEGGDHPALGLDRREPAEARVLQELERHIVS